MHKAHNISCAAYHLLIRPSTSGALKSRALPLYCRVRQATHVLADPGTRQLARSSAFAGAKCRGRQVPGAAPPGRCRHAQLPATDGTVAFAALAGRSRAGKCRLGAIVQLGRLWGACCVHVWATEGVGRVSSHVWGTQNDNCSGPACPAALVPLLTAPAAGSCLPGAWAGA